MASRSAKKHAKGGKAKVHMINAKGTPEARAAEDEKDEFKKGGKLKDGGRAEGHKAKHRGDKMPRGHKRAMGGKSPFSTGHNTTEPKGASNGHQSLRP